MTRVGCYLRSRFLYTFAMSFDSGPLLIWQTVNGQITNWRESFLAAEYQLRSSLGLSISGRNCVMNGWRRRIASQSWLREIHALAIHRSHHWLFPCVNFQSDVTFTLRYSIGPGPICLAAGFSCSN